MKRLKILIIYVINDHLMYLQKSNFDLIFLYHYHFLFLIVICFFHHHLQTLIPILQKRILDKQMNVFVIIINCVDHQFFIDLYDLYDYLMVYQGHISRKEL